MQNNHQKEKQSSSVKSPVIVDPDIISIPNLIENQNNHHDRYFTFQEIKLLILKALGIQVSGDTLDKDEIPELQVEGQKLRNMDIFDSLQQEWPEIGKGKNDKFTIDGRVKWFIPPRHS